MKKTKKIGEARIYDPVKKNPFPKTQYCAIDGCEAEATFLTANDMPLCTSCATAYELGQDNATEPLEEI